MRSKKLSRGIASLREFAHIGVEREWWTGRDPNEVSIVFKDKPRAPGLEACNYG